MNFNFDLSRLLLLALCLGAFAALGGFSPRALDRSGQQALAITNTTDPWLKCVTLFIAGAVCVSLVDHRVGLMEPTNLRPLYIVLGVIVMAAAIAWQHAIKHAP